MPIRYEVLADALAGALQECLGIIAREVDLRELAVFGLYTSGELNYLGPTAETKSRWPSLPFQWSPADWVFHGIAQDAFKEVDALLLEGWRDGCDTFDVDAERLVPLIVSILADVRRRAFTGTDVLVGLFVAGGHRWTDQSVEMINPPKVALRYR